MNAARLQKHNIFKKIIFSKISNFEYQANSRPQNSMINQRHLCKVNILQILEIFTFETLKDLA